MQSGDMSSKGLTLESTKEASDCRCNALDIQCPTMLCSNECNRDAGDQMQRRGWPIESASVARAQDLMLPTDSKLRERWVSLFCRAKNEMNAAFVKVSFPFTFLWKHQSARVRQHKRSAGCPLSLLLPAGHYHQPSKS